MQSGHRYQGTKITKLTHTYAQRGPKESHGFATVDPTKALIVLGDILVSLPP